MHRPLVGARLLALLVATVTGAISLAIWFDLSPLLRGPAPYPPEWQWGLRAAPSLAGAGWALAAGAAILGLLAATGATWPEPRRRAGVVLGLTLATGLGVAFQLTLLGLEEGGSAANTLVRRTISPVFTSYYSVAAAPVAADFGTFLDHHAELLPVLPLHAATHPPGAVGYYRATLALCQGLPGPSLWLAERGQRLSVDTRPFGGARPETAPYLAAALLAPLGLACFGAAACWPLYALARACGLETRAALRCGILWTLVPGAALVVPALDQLSTFLVAATTAALVQSGAAAARPGARAAWTASGTGLAALALFTSYGAAAFLAVACLWVLALRGDGRAGLARAWPPVLVAVLSAVALQALPAAWGHEPLAAFSTALRVHAENFTQPRAYRLWLVFNLWDLALFLGVPLALLGAFRAIDWSRDWASGRWPASPGLRLATAVLATVLALDLSGAVRGEAGRILMPLMPFCLLSALLARDDGDHLNGAPDRGSTGVVGPSVASALWLGSLLVTCCLVLRLRWHVP